MKKKLYYLTVYLMLSGHWTMSQTTQWEQIPSKIGNTTGPKNSTISKPYPDKNYNYGSESNPSPRINAVSWPDTKGGLWIFGGMGTAENYEWGLFNDMWKYDPSSNDWKLIKGGRNQVQFVSQELPLPRKEAAS